MQTKLKRTKRDDETYFYNSLANITKRIYRLSRIAKDEAQSLDKKKLEATITKIEWKVIVNQLSLTS